MFRIHNVQDTQCSGSTMFRTHNIQDKQCSESTMFRIHNVQDMQGTKQTKEKLETILLEWRIDLRWENSVQPPISLNIYTPPTLGHMSHEKRKMNVDGSYPVCAGGKTKLSYLVPSCCREEPAINSS